MRAAGEAPPILSGLWRRHRAHHRRARPATTLFSSVSDCSNSLKGYAYPTIGKLAIPGNSDRPPGTEQAACSATARSKVSQKKRSLEKPNAWVAAVPANSATPPGARQHRSGAPASRADRAHVREAAPQPSRVHPLRQSPVWLEVKAPVVSDFSSASRRPYLASHDANPTLFKISRVIIRYLLQCGLCSKQLIWLGGEVRERAPWRTIAGHVLTGRVGRG